jgi:hypothetical protein
LVFENEPETKKKKNKKNKYTIKTGKQTENEIAMTMERETVHAKYDMTVPQEWRMATEKKTGGSGGYGGSGTCPRALYLPTTKEAPRHRHRQSSVRGFRTSENVVIIIVVVVIIVLISRQIRRRTRPPKAKRTETVYIVLWHTSSTFKIGRGQ